MGWYCCHWPVLFPCSSGPWVGINFVVAAWRDVDILLFGEGRMKTIIEMAREAGLITNYGGREAASDELLEAFAELVRADEREACAKLADARAIEYDGFTEEQNASEKLAAAIRARGNT